jgi:hypothetical protein
MNQYLGPGKALKKVRKVAWHAKSMGNLSSLKKDSPKFIEKWSTFHKSEQPGSTAIS